VQALNAAAKALPTEPLLYITGAKLQEAHGDVKLVSKIINSAIKKKLPESGVIIDRETWLKEAETCEKASPPMLHTCRAIVGAVVDTAVDERERKDTYHRDAAECIQRSSYETARAILQHALSVFPDSERTWRAMADLEKNHGALLLRQVPSSIAPLAWPQTGCVAWRAPCW
jgi:pre-mRNA-processing factor 6